MTYIIRTFLVRWYSAFVVVVALLDCSPQSHVSSRTGAASTVSITDVDKYILAGARKRAAELVAVSVTVAVVGAVCAFFNVDTCLTRVVAVDVVIADITLTSVCTDCVGASSVVIAVVVEDGSTFVLVKAGSTIANVASVAGTCVRGSGVRTCGVVVAVVPERVGAFVNVAATYGVATANLGWVDCSSWVAFAKEADHLDGNAVVDKGEKTFALEGTRGVGTLGVVVAVVFTGEALVNVGAFDSFAKGVVDVSLMTLACKTASCVGTGGVGVAVVNPSRALVNVFALDTVPVVSVITITFVVSNGVGTGCLVVALPDMFVDWPGQTFVDIFAFAVDQGVSPSTDATVSDIYLFETFFCFFIVASWTFSFFPSAVGCSILKIG